MDLHSMTLPQLREIQDQLVARKADLDQRRAELRGELDSRFVALADIGYSQSGKDHGLVRLNNGDGVMVKVDRKQVVEWDQGKLLALMSGMSWEEAQHWFAIEIKMRETMFKALPPNTNFRTAVIGARTTRILPATYELLDAK